jgi:hypothetical protein
MCRKEKRNKHAESRAPGTMPKQAQAKKSPTKKAQSSRYTKWRNHQKKALLPFFLKRNFAGRTQLVFGGEKCALDHPQSDCYHPKLRCEREKEREQAWAMQIPGKWK